MRKKPTRKPTIRKLTDSALRTWVAGLIRRQRVIGVQADGERFAFKPLTRAEDLRLDYDVTKIPPKKLFQPAAEPLLEYDQAANYRSIFETEPFVLFGVHPYDMVAILQMDQVFSEKHCDAHYFARRQNATIVVCDVQKASPNVFAGCMGTATIRKGYDVLMTRVGGHYVVEAGSPKGEALMEGLKNRPEADEASLHRREQVWEDNAKFLVRHTLRMKPAEIPALLQRSEDHPVWEEKAARCFSCGSCNLVCPTCYCFDVRDDVKWDLQGGMRRRYWDGCMLLNFANVAGGHNFRKNRADRYRHRYYRKGLYVPAKLGGEISCVGCGRCITACVSKIANPVEIYNRLLEER